MFSTAKLKKLFSKSSGFTLIELLIVVTIIGIMSGVLLVVIDPQKQRARAQDGVRVGNISKLVQSVEAYRAGEGVYPDAQTKLTATDTKYVQNWPSDASSYVYFPNNPGTPTDYCLSVPMATATNRYIRYQSTGTGSMGSGKIHVNCSSACSAGYISDNVQDCTVL